MTAKIHISIEADDAKAAREAMRTLLHGHDTEFRMAVSEPTASAPTDAAEGTAFETAEPEHPDAGSGQAPIFPQHLTEAGYSPAEMAASEAQAHFDLLTKARNLGCKNIGVRSKFETLRQKIAEAKGAEPAAEPTDPEPEVLNLEQAKAVYGNKSEDTPTAETPKEATVEEMQDALMQLVSAGLKDEVALIVRRAGGLDDNGNPAMSKVPAANRAQVIADCKAAIAKKAGEAETVLSV